MAVALLDPPATETALRDRAAELADEVETRYQGAPDHAATATPTTALPPAGVPEFFEWLRPQVMSIASSPAWREHDLTTELLLLLERLRDEIADDPQGDDPQWRVRETLQRVNVVLRAMVRQLMHESIDRPEHAAHFVASELSDVEVSKVAKLLGTTPRMVASYRTGDVRQIRKHPDRITLVGQLVYELKGSMTPRGVLLWFDAPMAALGERTPRDLLDEDPAAHRTALLRLARGGRAQLDQSGADSDGVDQRA